MQTAFPVFSLLQIQLRLIRAAEQIVDGDIIIIRKADQQAVVRLPRAALIAADAVLADVQVEGYFELCVAPRFPQLAQSVFDRPRLLFAFSC